MPIMPPRKNVQPLKLLSPKTDVVFKLIFGDQRNTDILSSFLQAVIDLPAEEYEKITVIDPHLKADLLDDKWGVLDVKIQTKIGKKIDVEIQVQPETPMRERLIYYLAKMITEQIRTGDDYAVIKRAISVVITDFELIPHSSAYHHVFRLYDRQHESEFSDILEVNTLELPKLPKEQERSALYDWLQFFKVRKEEELTRLAEKNPMIHRAVGVLQKLSADERTRMLAEKREMLRMDIAATTKNAAKMGFERGMAEGKAEGKAEGRAETITEIVSKLLALSMPIDAVAAATGLSREEIETLR